MEPKFFKLNNRSKNTIISNHEMINKTELKLRHVIIRTTQSYWRDLNFHKKKLQEEK